jgi:hypothetical protein
MKDRILLTFCLLFLFACSNSKQFMLERQRMGMNFDWWEKLHEESVYHEALFRMYFDSYFEFKETSFIQQTFHWFQKEKR